MVAVMVEMVAGSGRTIHGRGSRRRAARRGDAQRRVARGSPLAVAGLAVLLGAALALAGCARSSSSAPGCDEGSDCAPALPCTGSACRADVALCGNGVIEEGERCDDGNAASGDGCDPTCQVAQCYVPVTHATVADAVADLACPIVYVHAGVHPANLMLLRALELVGVGAGPAILDGGAAGTVVTVDTFERVRLSNLTVRNGLANQGAGVHNRRGFVRLVSVIVTENTARGQNPAGGGLFNADMGTLSLASSTVLANRVISTASEGGAGGLLEGGGIYSASGAVILSDGTLVEANEISGTGATILGRGAGISASTSWVELNHSTVRGNVIELDGDGGQAVALGAGIYVMSGVLDTASGSSIEDNLASARGRDEGGAPGATAHGGGLHVDAGIVELDATTLRDNRVLARGDRSSVARAGGAALLGGSLRFTSSSATGNSATALGSTAAATGATAEYGGMQLEDVTTLLEACEISGNSAAASTESTSGGSAAIGGVGITVTYSHERATRIARCVIANNLASSEDGYAQAGAMIARSSGATSALDLRITESAIAGNTAHAPLGAQIGGMELAATGAGATLDASILNSTISGNTASSAAGDSRFGAMLVATSGASAMLDVTLASSTVTGNTATGGSGVAGGINVFQLSGAAPAVLRLKGAIVADNPSAIGADCRTANAVIVTGGYNLLGDSGACVFAGDTSTHLPGPAGLGPLTDNGGPTPTHELLEGSRAINAGDPAGCADHLGAPLDRDQRGLPRIARGRCDLGAYEAQ